MGKGRGWHGEPERHSRAARGIHTVGPDPGRMSKIIGARLDNITKALKKDGYEFGADIVKEAEWKASSDAELSQRLYKAANYLEEDFMELGKEMGWSEQEFGKAMVHIGRIHKLAQDLEPKDMPPEFFGR